MTGAAQRHPDKQIALWFMDEGSILATTAFVPGHPERIELLARRGSASLVGGSLRVCWVYGGEETVQAEGATGSGANIMDFSREAHRALIADFLDAVRDGRDPLVSGEEALASQRLVEEILRKRQVGTGQCLGARL